MILLTYKDTFLYAGTDRGPRHRLRYVRTDGKDAKNVVHFINPVMLTAAKRVNYFGDISITKTFLVDVLKENVDRNPFYNSPSNIFGNLVSCLSYPKKHLSSRRQFSRTIQPDCFVFVY